MRGPEASPHPADGLQVGVPLGDVGIVRVVTRHVGHLAVLGVAAVADHHLRHPARVETVRDDEEEEHGDQPDAAESPGGREGGACPDREEETAEPLIEVLLREERRPAAVRAALDPGPVEDRAGVGVRKRLVAGGAADLALRARRRVRERQPLEARPAEERDVQTGSPERSVRYDARSSPTITKTTAT